MVRLVVLVLHAESQHVVDACRGMRAHLRMSQPRRSHWFSVTTLKRLSMLLKAHVTGRSGVKLATISPLGKFECARQDAQDV